jgi:hypothetical protein
VGLGLLLDVVEHFPDDTEAKRMFALALKSGGNLHYHADAINVLGLQLMNVMKENIKLLDCTLRDGGYHNAWNFSPELINSYLNAMKAVQVDIVELGFRFLNNEASKDLVLSQLITLYVNLIFHLILQLVLW